MFDFRLLSTGCSVHVEGDLVKSVGKDQDIEVQATNVTVIGQCDNDVSKCLSAFTCCLTVRLSVA